MKKIKTKLLMSLSALIIIFLMNASSLNIISTQALLDTNENQNNLDSFDRSAWKWSCTEVVSTESAGDSYHPSLAIDIAGNVHIAWDDYTNYAGSGTERDIFYKRWDASSSAWTITEVVSTESTATSYSPSLAVDTLGNLHIAWEDWTDYNGAGTGGDIFYKRWDASTSSWTITEVVSTESTDTSRTPSLAVDAAGDVHIAWNDQTDYAGAGTEMDIFYKRWNTTSSLWTTTEVVSTESTGSSWHPSLVADAEGNVHITWQDRTDYAGAGTDYDIFYKHWDASTSIWTTTEVISTESTSHSYHPSLAIDIAGNVHIAWEDWTDYNGAGTDYDIFYKLWNSSTSTWTPIEVVSTESTEDSKYPSLAIDVVGDVHIAWYDYTNYTGAGTERDIFYKRWDASTSSWTITEVVSTESTGKSFNPSLAVDTLGNLHIAWDDWTDYVGAGSDRDIFYKILTGSPATPELAFIVPNPTDIEAVFLDWNNVAWAINYHVYRSTSYIWSVEGLVPIATVSSSDYIDTVTSEGFYYYVVVAENFAGNSSHSNCQYVEVSITDLDAPELSTILPNPTELSSISLIWDDVDGATEYYVYRSTSYIWSVEGLTPITTVGSPSYVDSLPSEDYYFYVIVASDGLRTSIHSNCEYIEYKLPTLHEFFIISSLIIGIPVFLFAITRLCRKKSKQS
jgi:ribosomal protein L31/fibronectin type 3 domain-containing protein